MQETIVEITPTSQTVAISHFVNKGFDYRLLTFNKGMDIVNKGQMEKRNAIPPFCEPFGIRPSLIGDEAVLYGLFE